MTARRTAGARPAWLRIRLPSSDSLERVDRLVREGGLHTVCQEAHCPNIHECYGMGTATFLILGEVCTRKCGFCAVAKGAPAPVDPDEPLALAHAARRMKLRHVVITSVDRDDLPDGGATHFARTLEALGRLLPRATTEVLTPDFRSDPRGALATVLAARPTIFSHNLETVRRLYPAVRPGSNYDLSLELLAAAARCGTAPVKSSLILGLGEREPEIIEALADLRRAGVQRVNIGQYLSPSRRHIPVKRYYRPEEFDAFAARARAFGFARVEAGPLVRSSYHAAV